MKLRMNRLAQELVPRSAGEMLAEFRDSPSAFHFDHFSGTMVVPNHPRADSTEATQVTDWLRQQTASLETDEDKFQRAMELTVDHHEHRHFYDCFCTPAGVRLLDDYALAVEGLANAEGPRTSDHTTSEIKPHESAPILHGALNRLTIATLAYQAPAVYLDGTDDETDIVLLDLTHEGTIIEQIPCLTVNMATADGLRFIRLWPVGFYLVTECLASFWQSTLVGSVDESYVQRIFDSYRVSKGGDEHPYSVIPTALTTMMRRRGATEALDLEMLWDILTKSLFLGCPPGAGHLPPGEIGRAFVNQLEDCVSVADGKIDYRPLPVDRAWWKADPNAESATFGARLVRKEYLNVALDIPIPPGIGWSSLAGFLWMVGRLPMPPIIVSPGDNAYVHNASFLEFLRSWTLYREIVLSVYTTQNYICPARNPLFASYYPRPSLLPSGQICVAAIAADSCGRWNPGGSYNGPSCMWTELLHRILGDASPVGVDELG